jgi:hypothetical protein
MDLLELPGIARTSLQFYLNLSCFVVTHAGEFLVSAGTRNAPWSGSPWQRYPAERRLAST